MGLMGMYIDAEEKIADLEKRLEDAEERLEAWRAYRKYYGQPEWEDVLRRLKDLGEI